MEHAFGMLKKRFPALLYQLRCRNIDNTQAIIGKLLYFFIFFNVIDFWWLYITVFLWYMDMVTWLHLHTIFETNRKHSFLASIPDSKACQSSSSWRASFLTYTCIESQAHRSQRSQRFRIGMSRFPKKRGPTEFRTLDPWCRETYTWRISPPDHGALPW